MGAYDCAFVRYYDWEIWLISGTETLYKYCIAHIHNGKILHTTGRYRRLAVFSGADWHGTGFNERKLSPI